MTVFRLIIITHKGPCISTQEKFPRTENFAKISLLTVENLSFTDGKFVLTNHVSQNFLSAENFPEWKWDLKFTRYEIY